MYRRTNEKRNIENLKVGYTYRICENGLILTSMPSYLRNTNENYITFCCYEKQKIVDHVIMYYDLLP